MAAKHHRGHWNASSFAVMLVSSLLRERPPPRLPGKPRKTTPPTYCPRDKIALIPAANGKLRCPECGYIWDPSARS
jgi:hypothetical protein